VLAESEVRKHSPGRMPTITNLRQRAPHQKNTTGDTEVSKEVAAIRTTGQLRAALGRMLTGLESGAIDPDRAAAACKIANAINQTFAEETKAMLAAKELGLVKPAFGQTLIGEAGADDSAPPHAALPAPTAPGSRVARHASVYRDGVKQDAGSGRDFSDS
jgi:hypothetical protein